jgi:hypothetical protein
MSATFHNLAFYRARKQNKEYIEKMYNETVSAFDPAFDEAVDAYYKKMMHFYNPNYDPNDWTS